MRLLLPLLMVVVAASYLTLCVAEPDHARAMAIPYAAVMLALTGGNLARSCTHP